MERVAGTIKRKRHVGRDAVTRESSCAYYPAHMQSSLESPHHYHVEQTHQQGKIGSKVHVVEVCRKDRWAGVQGNGLE